MTQQKVKRRGGRPRKPAKELQSERSWMFLTQEEADRIFRASVITGETISEYLRRTGLPGALAEADRVSQDRRAAAR